MNRAPVEVGKNIKSVVENKLNSHNLAFQAGCRGFKSRLPLHFLYSGFVR